MLGGFRAKAQPRFQSEFRARRQIVLHFADLIGAVPTVEQKRGQIEFDRMDRRQSDRARVSGLPGRPSRSSRVAALRYSSASSWTCSGEASSPGYFRSSISIHAIQMPRRSLGKEQNNLFFGTLHFVASLSQSRARHAAVGSASRRPQWFSTDEKGACRAWLVVASPIGPGRDQVGVSLGAGLRASLKPACGRLHPFRHASLTRPLPHLRRLACLSADKAPCLITEAVSSSPLRTRRARFPHPPLHA